MSKEDPTQIASTYLHVGNSGLTVSIHDTGRGPELRFHTSSFGNLVNDLRVMVTKDGLSLIKEMIEVSLKAEYSKNYCHAARPVHSTGSEGSTEPISDGLMEVVERNARSVIDDGVMEVVDAEQRNARIVIDRMAELLREDVADLERKLKRSDLHFNDVPGVKDDIRIRKEVLDIAEHIVYIPLANSDDMEPITREWLNESFEFKERTEKPGWFCWSGFDYYHHEPDYRFTELRYLNHILNVKTRGEFRRLVALLKK